MVYLQVSLVWWEPHLGGSLFTELPWLPAKLQHMATHTLEVLVMYLLGVNLNFKFNNLPSYLGTLENHSPQLSHLKSVLKRFNSNILIIKIYIFVNNIVYSNSSQDHFALNSLIFILHNIIITCCKLCFVSEKSNFRIPCHLTTVA